MENNQENIIDELFNLLINDDRFKNSNLKINIKIFEPNIDSENNLSISSQTTIKQIIEINNNLTINPLQILLKQIFKGLIKEIDEIKYFKIFEPNHYDWLHNPENPENILNINNN